MRVAVFTSDILERLGINLRTTLISLDAILETVRLIYSIPFGVRTTDLIESMMIGTVKFQIHALIM